MSSTLEKSDTFLDLCHSLFLEGTNILAGKGKFLLVFSYKAFCLVVQLRLNFSFRRKSATERLCLVAELLALIAKCAYVPRCFEPG